MKKLLLASLMFLTSCSDRYDFVLRIESEIPGVNVEALNDTYFGATYKERTILITGSDPAYWGIKLLNQTPESKVIYVYDKDLETSLKTLFHIVEETK